MKIFQSVLRDCVVLGLGQQKLTQKYPLNKENVQAFIILCIAISSTSVSLFHETNTFQDYAVSVYASSTAILTAALYLIFVWENQAFCELIENTEKALNESKLNFESMH